MNLELTRPGAAARHAEGWRGALDQLSAVMGLDGSLAESFREGEGK
jgi:hypothetical protein